MALVDLWTFVASTRNWPEFGRTTCQYLYLGETLDILHANVQNNVVGQWQQDVHRQRLFSMYINMMKLDNSLLEKVKSVLGSEFVEIELTQWFLDDEQHAVYKWSDAERVQYDKTRLKYLSTIPDKQSSMLLNDHKQYVLKFIDRCANGVDLISNMCQTNLPHVLRIILDDPPNNDTNQRWLINKLREMSRPNSPWGNINSGFRLLHPFIQSIDQCLQFFHLFNLDNMITLITRLGQSFQQYYKYCEQYIMATLDKGLTKLVLLPSVINCLGGTVGVMDESITSLLSKLNNMPLNTNTLLVCAGHTVVIV
ncbi:hypothetical protein SAMD00019534_040660 [Acytostelium subglobosum LB1]|uniref:hypothetical protein n=1 Tax=Acytostelium subglobosum LB1 TaxID=1410327 RepID=UPI000644C8E2|nr:hypothetical protein SAMD00019534_040660 [Acytostelium subglobosum LB1]GAM20891.1 hypothetical protein SAMD00019534_040660 [Acytostelium subglobosum LB1]|eukprot:XP_012756025.1 hypothetical protein SAMD00019534_040660 [Acytostelium subglobosum LB1]